MPFRLSCVNHFGRWLGILSGSVLVLMISAGCGLTNISFGLKIDLEHYDASEAITQEIPYSGQRIVLENLLGKISVEGIETAVRPFIRLEAVKKARGLKLEEVQIHVVQDSGGIHIQSDLPSQVRRNLKLFPPRIEEEVGWVEFTLKVPQDARLSLDERAGTIQISGFRGELEASTQLGDISVENSTATVLSLLSQMGGVRVSSTSANELVVNTQFGDLELDNVTFTSARLSVEAGSVTVTASQGEGLTASAQAGSISISKSQLQSVDLETQAGSIELALTGLQEGRVDTQLGGITLELPRLASLSIEAETQLGGIKLRGLELDSGVQAQWGGSWPGETLTIRLGNAQSKLELSTQLGGIEITFVK